MLPVYFFVNGIRSRNGEKLHEVLNCASVCVLSGATAKTNVSERSRKMLSQLSNTNTEYFLMAAWRDDVTAPIVCHQFAWQS